MAKINNTDIYKYDTMPTLLDYLIGTDADNLLKTKNYKIKAIFDLINGASGINSIQYYFSDGSTPDIDYFSQGFMFTDNNALDPNNFTKLIFNNRTETGLNLSVLFAFLGLTPDVVLKIKNPTDPNNFFTFKVTGYTDEGDYVAFDVEQLDDLYLGIFVNGYIYSFYWDVYSSGGPIETDNIDIIKTVVLADGYLHSDLFAAVNNLTTFQVLGTESLWLEVLVLSSGSISQTRLYKFFNLGKGIYGLGGIQLQVDPSTYIVSCKLIEINGFNPEENPTTQIVDEGWDITGTTLSDYINNLATPITLQDTNSEGLVVIKVLNFGVSEEYLYNGAGGTFGLGEQQTILSEFNKFNSSSGLYTNLTDGQELDLPYAGSNTFTLPDNYLITDVYTNIALNKKATYIRSALNQITILDTLEAGDVINVRGLVATGSFAPMISGGCLTAECVQAMPVFNSDIEAISLPNYTPYKTNTGEIRYKLPSGEPILMWIDSETWNDELTWID